jgi:hypothetical protein
MKEEISSYHIFMFPFSLKGCGTREEYEKYLHLNDWANEGFNYSKGDYARNFSAQAYFYEFASGALFDDNSPYKVIATYKLAIGEQAKYTINMRALDKGKIKKEHSYCLDIDKIELNIYDEKVAILSFHLSNAKYSAIEDILNINDFGRHIFPQFLSKNENNEVDVQNTKNSFLADSIKIDLGNGHVYEDNFTRYNNMQAQPFVLPDFIAGILPKEMHNAHWLLDDRMFVLSWYKNEEFAAKLKSYDPDDIDKSNEMYARWYEYVFVDNDGPTCKSNTMFSHLLKSATYDRWAEERGTLFGASRYSFVAIESSTFILQHMQTVYYLMASLCLAQRTLSLYYSNEISDICKRMNDESLKGSSLYNEVRELNRDYLRFVNNIFFREITPQDQGAELYNLMQNQMHVGRDEKELNTEIEQLYQYVNMTGDQRRNKEAQDLNLIATLMLPATVIAGIFGMNSLSEVNLGFGIEVVVIVVFSIIMFYAIKILGKK